MEKKYFGYKYNGKLNAFMELCSKYKECTSLEMLELIKSDKNYVINEKSTEKGLIVLIKDNFLNSLN